VGSKKLIAQLPRFVHMKKKKPLQEGGYRPEMQRNEGEKLKMEKRE
jgi:hypothetical protein